MGTKTIPQLHENTVFDENSLFMYDSGVQTYKITGANLAQGIRPLSVAPVIPAKTANYSPAAAQESGVIPLNSSAGSFNVQLPDPATMMGKRFTIKDVGNSLKTFPVTLVRFGSEKIDGIESSFIFNVNRGSWVIFSDGTDWVFLTLPEQQPIFTTLSATGTTTGHIFRSTSGNVTAGDVYTNNGNSYTMVYTFSGNGYFTALGAGAPTSGGTLTKFSGAGGSSATITFTSFIIPFASFVPNARSKRMRVRGTGAGSGGGGSGTTPTVSTAGGTTYFFDTNKLRMGGGNPVGATGQGQSSTGYTIDSSIEGVGSRGSPGTGGSNATNSSGGNGGSNCIGSGGMGGVGNVVSNPGTGYLGGGGGGGGGASALVTSGGGGAPGATVDVTFNGLDSFYPYAIGLAGAGGIAGASGGPGAAGGDGVIFITEY